MTIDELNALPSGAAREVLRPCVDIDAWIDTLVDARPYADSTALMDRAIRAAAVWSDTEVDRALADHPRIGERPTGDTAAADHSRAEQAGAGDLTADADLAARLADGNRRYEARFGRVYLVRAAGRSGAEMLGLLEQRLGNDDVTEAEETKRQLAEIAILRLRSLVEQGEDAA